MTERTLIIAEGGVNHNGSRDRALAMVDRAAEAGADFVKFQTFRADALATGRAGKAPYQKETTDASESQLAMLTKLELSRAVHAELLERCRQKGIRFLSTPFDLESVELLAELDLPLFKVPSGEITNLPYLRRIGSKGKPVILSTGMACLGEIEDALEVLTGSGVSIKDIIVLHCHTEYPTPFTEVNLRAMLSIREAFGVRVGYSDHTAGLEVSIAAVALGAVVIEKHFTLDKTLPGPDHSSSLDATELTVLVRSIRNVEAALGSGVKKPSKSELANAAVVRKSVVAACPIQKGELYTTQNLAAKRPASGISPMRWDEIVGRTADRDYHADEMIQL